MFKKHIQELEYLQKLGFPTNPLNRQVNGILQAWEYAKELEQKRDKLPYQIDGVVVKIDDNQVQEKLGVVGKTPRGWCAIKFAAEEVATKLTGITWQVGRTGKLTPVAELEPVLLQGTTVKRASLHNYKEVNESGIAIGDMLIIRKAGDIIPEVVKIIKLHTEEVKQI
jgi:DNA ligase (NAD+)